MESQIILIISLFLIHEIKAELFKRYHKFSSNVQHERSNYLSLQGKVNIRLRNLHDRT